MTRAGVSRWEHTPARPELETQNKLEEVMATTMYFEEMIHDQGDKATLEVEIGRSSFYKEDSIYLTVDGKTVVMHRATAKRFVEAVVAVGHYHNMID